jgi:hypothetical protein
MNGKFRQWWMLDLLACVGLMLYVLAGADEVPLHGDEPTLIYMSRDYHFLVQERDLDPILYAADADPAEQELRLINGTVTKWTIGLAWDLAGMTVADVNAPRSAICRPTGCCGWPAGPRRCSPL